ncbi:MAG: pseudouridine synthase [Lachnospiraceae bacterium]|nr:pseudouridine synthase [Lachnospiraceae bacterium]
MTRLNKYLAECGVCSRREADKLIDQGRVRVNAQKAVSGMQVSAQDVIEVSGKKVKPASAKVVLAYHKPVGITCTEKDRHAEKTIVEAVKYPVRLTYAGRLDKESDGLMIMTNDGELIQRMMKGANRHEKEYVVKVNREITDEFLSGMANGVWLKDLGETTRPCKLERIGKYTFKIILTQGLNRQIRRMCESFGYQVKSLTRVRVMNIELAGLNSGAYREVKGEELSTLYSLCGMEKNAGQTDSSQKGYSGGNNGSK